MDTGEIKKKLEQHSIVLNELNVSLQLNNEVTNRIRQTVWGNGVPGLDEVTRGIGDRFDKFVKQYEQHRMEALERIADEQVERKKKAEKEEEDRQWFRRLVIGAAVTTIIVTGIPLTINAWLLYIRLKAGLP